MSQNKPWYKADSESEKVEIITEGVLQELDDSIELSDLYSRADEIDNIQDEFNPDDNFYPSPFTSMRHFDVEDKPVPADSARLIEQSETLFIGIARAVKAGLEKLEAQSSTMPLDEISPDRLVKHIIGLTGSLAVRIERKPWSDEMDGVFFDDPVYIETVHQ